MCVYVVCLQMDLEPEGKVYIHVSLTGSFIDGKAAAVMRASCVNEAFAHSVLQQCLQFLPIDFVPVAVLNNVWEPVLGARPCLRGRCGMCQVCLFTYFRCQRTSTHVKLNDLISHDL